MNRAYEETLLKTLREKLYLPDEHLYAELNGAGKVVLDEIIQGLNHDDPEVAIAFARLLVASFPEQAAELLFERIDRTDTASADQLLGLLAKIDTSHYRERLYRLAERGDEHFRATIVLHLSVQQDPDYLEQAIQLLDHANPRLRAAAIHYCLHHPASKLEPDVLARQWLALIQGNNGSCKAALALIPFLPLSGAGYRKQLEAAYQEAFARLLTIDDKETRICTFRKLSHWAGEIPETAYPALVQALSDDSPEIRTAAAGCLHLGGQYPATSLALQAVSDSHPAVRQAGIRSLKAISDDFPALALGMLEENKPSLRGQHALLESLVASGLPKSDCERLALLKAQEAHRLQDGITALETGEEPGSPAGSLVKLVLRERLEQTIQLALLALEPLHDAETIRIIRAGFASGEQRHIENAIEAFGNIEGSAAVKLLMQVMTRIYDHQQQRHGAPHTRTHGYSNAPAISGRKWKQGVSVSDMFKRLLLLKRSQIFSMVPTEDLRRVAGSLEEIRFFSGDRIFEINDQGDHLYLLVSGKVGISIDPNHLNARGARRFTA